MNAAAAPNDGSASARSRVAVRVLTVCVWLAALGVAWLRRFVQDDAYISWRYARNFAEGRGLVWNEGERVEGYTNFLWTLLSAIPEAAGIRVEPFTWVLGVLLFGASLLLFRALVVRFTGDGWVGLAALVALGFFYTFSAYATGGMETQLQTALVLGAAHAAWGRGAEAGLSFRRSVLLGVLVTGALMTRLDSVVLLGPLLLPKVLLQVRRGRAGLLPLLPLVAIPLLCVGGWFLWKLAYYGAVLPNTFAVKVHRSRTAEGALYLLSFLWTYAFVPALLGALLALRAVRTARRWAAAAFFGAAALWLGYLVYVGGDFMEYRFMVPVLPLLLLLAFWGWALFAPAGWARAVAVALSAAIVAGSVFHQRVDPSHNPFGEPEPVWSLAAHLTTPGDRWVEIGRRLGAAFPGPDRPRIAVTPAGAIPYFSDLPAVDMLGLNDPAVERFATLPEQGAGHDRLITYELLRERGTNFLIAHPVVRDRRGLPADHRFGFEDFARGGFFRLPFEERLRGLPLVEVPLAGGAVLLMVYLERDPEVDAALPRLGWRTYPLH